MQLWSAITKHFKTYQPQLKDPKSGNIKPKYIVITVLLLELAYLIWHIGLIRPLG